jgi:hypothetical protein
LSRALLVEAYVAALPLTAVAVVSSPDGRQCRIETGGTSTPAFYFKPSHAELVLSAIDLDGWTDQSAAAVAALIERTAAAMGAPYQTHGELLQAAEQAVADIVARVDAMRQNGGLKQVNAEYKRYRTQQMAKAERATTYSVFLQRFTETIVRDVAASGRSAFLA